MIVTTGLRDVEVAKAILLFLHQYTSTHGYAPTTREIGVAAGVRSTSQISLYLRDLCNCSLICREHYVARGVTLTEAGVAFVKGETPPNKNSCAICGGPMDRDILIVCCGCLRDVAAAHGHYCKCITFDTTEETWKYFVVNEKVKSRPGRRP